MDKNLYLRAKRKQYWCNFQEVFAYAAQYRPTPSELIYEHGVKFGEGKQQYINTYCRKDLVDKKKPLFLYIHGGGWVSGITEMRNTYISNWAKLGFYTASVSYTYAPKKVYPYQLKEIFKAIDFIFDSAKEKNIDTENIVISGESAGGYFISAVATLANDKEKLTKLGIDFKNCGKVKLNAMVMHSGCFNLKSLLDPAKQQAQFPKVDLMVAAFLGIPEKEAFEWLSSEEGKLAIPEIDKNFPPIFINWAVKDFLRFESFDLMEVLDGLGVPYEQYKCDGLIAKHAWSIVTVVKPGKECLKKTLDFVLPYVPEYFAKESDGWKFISK